MIHRLARIHLTPRRRESVARTVSPETRRCVIPSSKATCAAISRVQRLLSWPNSLGERWSNSLKDSALCSSKAFGRLLSPTNHAAWTGLVCAVLFRERLRAGRGVLNHRIVGAFLTAVVLHALWDFFNSLAGMAIVDLISNLLSLLVAIVSLTLLIRRVREARRAPPMEQP